MQVTKDLLCTLWNTIYITTTPVIQVRRATMGRSGIRFGELEAESRGWRAVKSQITCHAARTGLRRNILLTELLTCFNTWDYQSKQCQIVQTSHNMIGFFRHDIGLICSVLPQSKNNLEKQLAKTMQNGHRSMQKKSKAGAGSKIAPLRSSKVCSGHFCLKCTRIYHQRAARADLFRCFKSSSKMDGLDRRKRGKLCSIDFP